MERRSFDAGAAFYTAILQLRGTGYPALIGVPIDPFPIPPRNCGPLAGSKSLMSSGQLAERHPTHAAYVSQMVQRTQALVREGWLLAEDASTIRREAAESKVPLEAPLPWRGVGGRRGDSRRRVASRSSSNT